MPTVAREDGFSIKVDTRGEHNQPHVHIIKAGGEIRVKIGDEQTAPSYWDEKRPMSTADKLRTVLLVEKHQNACLETWRKFNANAK